MIYRLFYTAFVFLLLSSYCSAQALPVNDYSIEKKYSFIHSVLNRISNPRGLDSFYRKLATLKKEGQGVISIVHIGDSHIQAGFLPGVVRNGLQDFFGNAGRGLVFPYQLAKGNAPADIGSTSVLRWQFNRIAHPEIAITPGISGYTIETRASLASFSLALRNDPGRGKQSFNRLKIFINQNNADWLIQPDYSMNPFPVVKQNNDSLPYRLVTTEKTVSSFYLSTLSSNELKEFYGVSLENSEPGVIYHSIGVNGSRYDHFNAAGLFWKQLPALEADLYIISLGTNEAQSANFNEAAFLEQLNIFLEKLRKSSPEAAILITTAPDSYRARRQPNSVLMQFNRALAQYCSKHHIPLWDLYQITNGYGSSRSWAKRGLMNPDKIHFTADGYNLQGSLLLNALAKAYNSYISTY